MLAAVTGQRAERGFRAEQGAGPDGTVSAAAGTAHQRDGNLHGSPDMYRN